MRYLLTLFLLLVTGAAAMSQNDFDSYMKEKNQAFADYSEKAAAGQKARQEEWESYHAASIADYQSYMDAVAKEYEEYKKRVIAAWGKENFIEESAKEVVEYSDDLQTRMNIDFEAGTAEVAILAGLEEDVTEIAGKLKNAVVNFLETKLDIDVPPIFQNQIDSKDYGLSGNSTPDELASKIIDDKESVTIDTDEGEKKLVKVRIELAEDHLSERAVIFKDIIRRYAGKFSMEEPLIYAVIEQESAFNPRARSSAPAYGLMQLVPRYGGREAFRHVYGKDFIPLPFYLYDPENNIELGTGYLDKLMNVTFANVRDQNSRMLCAIAAYNTGPGNVCKTVSGSTSASKAIPVVNSMSYDELFRLLRRKLPHSETRNYIVQVTEKRKKYIR